MKVCKLDIQINRNEKDKKWRKISRDQRKDSHAIRTRSGLDEENGKAKTRGPIPCYIVSIVRFTFLFCMCFVCVCCFFSFSLTLSLFFVVSLFYSFFFFFSFSSSFLISWSGILSTIRFRKKKNQQSPNLILLISWSARSAPDSLTPPGGPCDPGSSLGFSSPPCADRDPWDRYPRARSWRPSPETIDCNVDV